MTARNRLVDIGSRVSPDTRLRIQTSAAQVAMVIMMTAMIFAPASPLMVGSAIAELTIIFWLTAEPDSARRHRLCVLGMAMMIVLSLLMLTEHLAPHTESSHSMTEMAATHRHHSAHHSPTLTAVTTLAIAIWIAGHTATVRAGHTGPIDRLTSLGMIAASVAMCLGLL